MTVLTLDQAKRIAPDAFGLGEPPGRCDLCQRSTYLQHWPHGPFTVWVCGVCAERLAPLAKPERGA